MTSEALHHDDSPEGFTPKQLMLGGTMLLGLAGGIYGITPAAEMERVDLGAVSKEIKVGDKVGKIFLGNGAHCHVDDRGNYTLTIPEPSAVELDGTKTQVNMDTAGMIMSKSLAGTLITLNLWKNSHDVCASQVSVALNQILNKIVKKN